MELFDACTDALLNAMDYLSLDDGISFALLETPQKLVQSLDQVVVFVTMEAELQFLESIPERLYLIFNVPFIRDHIMDEPCQDLEVLLFHAKASHLRDTHSQAP